MSASRCCMILLLTAVCTVAAAGCGRRGPEGNAGAAVAKAPVPVEAVTVEMEDLQEFNEFPGTVQSRVTVEVSARISAHILEMPIRAGSLVKQGDLLVRLDDRDVQSRLSQVESALTSAKAVLTEKETDFKRYQQLLGTGTASQQQLDQARTLYETAKAGVAQVEEQVKEAKINLGYTEIRSPLDGIVVDKHVQSGDLAAPGRSLLTIQKPTDLWLEASVSEGCARRIHVDDQVAIAIDSFDTPIGSHVTEIVPAVDPKSRSFLVRATLPSNLALQPGMFGRLDFRCEKRKVLAVPTPAVVTRGQLDAVYVIQDGHAILHLARLGRVLDDKVEVLSGVAAGDAIVVKPPPELMDGDPVVVQPPPAPGTPVVAPTAPAAAPAKSEAETAPARETKP